MRLLTHCVTGLLAVGLVVAAPPVHAQSAPTDTLPFPLQAAVRAAGCQVPLWPLIGEDSAPSREWPVVWRGEVRAVGQLDWVVLCDRDRQRTALIFAAPFTTSSKPVLTVRMPGEPAGDGCEGWIRIAEPAQVRSAIQQLPETSPIRVQLSKPGVRIHAGILDGFCEGGGSHIRYWTGTRWLTLPDGYREG